MSFPAFNPPVQRSEQSLTPNQSDQPPDFSPPWATGSILLKTKLRTEIIKSEKVSYLF